GEGFTHITLGKTAFILFSQSEEAGTTLFLDRLSNMTAHPGSGCSGAFAVAENMHPGKIHLLNERLANGKFLIRLAGETDNDIGGDVQAGNAFAGGGDQRAKLLLVGAAQHPAQGGIAAALQRQMKMATQARVLPQVEKLRRQVPRFEGGKA